MSTAPVVGVLALQGDVREHLAMLERAGAHSRRRCAARRSSTACDGLVMPGGESTTMAKLARTFELLDPLRERLRGGMPAFGTCAGMIMLADRIEDGVVGQETFGGLDITVRRNAFGRQVDSFEADLDLAGLDDPFHARVHPGAVGRDRSGPTSRSSPASAAARPWVGSSRSGRGR